MNQRHGMSQVMGSVWCLLSHSFVLEKCLQVKKPLCADRGDGWGACKMRCFGLLMRADFLMA